MSQPTVVSALGMVLIAGGYLVLDSAYSGIVISTSSKIYTVISSLCGSNVIQVCSPQFSNLNWSYSVSSTTVKALQTNMSSNNFVQLALQHTISVALKFRGNEAVNQVLANGLDIAIIGDNDFYSQRGQNLSQTLSALSSMQPFYSQGVTLSQVHKTGLSSSAALIGSLVSTLLVHLQVVAPLAFLEDQGNIHQLIHNLSQSVHCLAQGKVGCGFDVAAAIFGSNLYTQFNPGVMNDLSSRSILSIISPDNAAWNQRIKLFRFPPLTHIMLANIDHGSDIPLLVGKVLQWCKDDPDKAHALWTSLDQLNQSLVSSLSHLSILHTQDPRIYASTVKFISLLQPIQWIADLSFDQFEAQVAAGFYQVHKVSKMLQLARALIEPPEQLLYMCCCQAGVIGGGTSGEGGSNVIWVLVCEPQECQPDEWPRECIEYIWSNHNVFPLSGEESVTQGARLESINNVEGL
ncbi:hypothetical protein GYMLUDRAFT_76514 [Collybiopsis luxurians FD-317 M1]|uniref:Phosphomevalonate kinase n=1 Tax=Collybiopsis luxurians FD-317 M1 TaxID=944289 RepID=A0A0D0AXP6_9AGAR|nr:hypothetical protein GYMLUDRAFT_76514 [Collybiopsis luxurians FD-317 M1]